MAHKEDSICWFCEKACTKECSWAEKFEPVDGWVAEKTETNCCSSYRVIECPLFTPEDVGKCKASDGKNLNDAGVLALIERVLEETRMDYLKATPVRKTFRRDSTRMLIEKWLRSEEGGFLCGFSDPETIIQRLREQAAEYDKRKARMRMA